MDINDLKSRIEGLFSDITSDSPEEKRDDETRLEDAVLAGLLDDQAEAASDDQPRAGRAAMGAAGLAAAASQATPPLDEAISAQFEEEAWVEPPEVGPETLQTPAPGRAAFEAERRAEPPLEEAVSDRFDRESWVEPAAPEPVSPYPASSYAMTGMDAYAMNDETQASPELPPQATDHPLYQEVEKFINQGDWQAAQAPLNELLTLYPDDPYLVEIAASIRARAALLAAPEAAPRRRPLLARSLRVVIPAVAVVALLVIAAVVLLVLQSSILPRVSEERQRARISQMRQDAQLALSSGDYDRAMSAYEDILELLPDDPEATAGMQQASELRATASRYSEAVAAMEAFRWEDALAILQQIEAEQAGYRDVTDRIAFVREQQDLSARFREAEAAFDRGYYELAAEEYEGLQAADSGFQRETVQDHLFLSYLQLGLAQIAEAGDDPEQLQSALDNFENALTLRPDDSQARGESQLIRRYLTGLEALGAGDWSQGIADLTPVYEARPDFADGSVAQRLHDARIAFGDELLADGQADQALIQYREARLIINVDTGSAELKIASAEAMLVTPTLTPEPVAATATAEVVGGAPVSGGSGPAAPPPATPVPLPYTLKTMSVRSNCSGSGYIHGVVWSAYNLPLSGVILQAYNTTTGFGPLTSLPTNADGIYQFVLEASQIEGLWVVQVLENNRPSSQAWGQRLGGGCQNGAQELKVDWVRSLETP